MFPFVGLLSLRPFLILKEFLILHGIPARQKDYNQLLVEPAVVRPFTSPVVAGVVDDTESRYSKAYLARFRVTSCRVLCTCVTSSMIKAD